MRLFRSKSNFMFGTVLLSALILFEIPALIKLSGGGTMPEYGKFLLIIPIVVAFYMFVLGMQVINISDRGVTLEVFRIPLKDIEWEKINEAGTGKIKISRGKYMRQLYVSQKQLTEEQIENLDKMRLDSSVIWFDYSLKAQDSLALHLGINSE